MFKKEKGITLVALVVTIIILLILAGVAITMALSDNGLFHKTKEAVNTWKDSETLESNRLTEGGDIMQELMNQYRTPTTTPEPPAGNTAG